MMDYFYCIESPTRARPFQCFKSYSFSLKNKKQKTKQGALGNSHYWHNNHQFPSVTLSRAVVESALKNAGCLVVDWRELARCCSPQDKPADHSAVFYCLARKNTIQTTTTTAK